VLRYYWEHKTPEQTAADLTELMQHYRQKWGTKRFILAGYSFGADVMPAVYNRLPTEDQDRIDGIILLAFARTGSFEIHVDGWLGTAGKETTTGPEMAKLPGDKVLCVYGIEEKDESGCTEATAVGEKLQLPGGHHFDENYPALAKRLIAAIDKRQGKTPSK
jgi:type IV secretory pathway VirJ component